jgi:hypothetical protein
MFIVVLLSPSHFAIVREQPRKFPDPGELIVFAPSGEFDLAEHFRTLQQPYRQPSCLACFSDTGVTPGIEPPFLSFLDPHAAAH